MTDAIRIPVGPSGKPVAWATIDFGDYERVVAYRWYLNSRGYAFTPYAKGKSMFLHGFVVGRLDEDDGLDVDHINRDTLDNRRGNLRVVTRGENALNSDRCDVVADRRERARAMRVEGMHLGEIATKLDIAPAVAGVYCRGIPGPPEHPNLKWTRDRIADAFLSFYGDHGRAPKHQDLNGGAMPWFITVYRRFPGALGEAREYAGLERGQVVRRKYADRAAA